MTALLKQWVQKNMEDFRTYGLGVTPTDVYGNAPSHKMVQNMAFEYQEEMKRMEIKFVTRLDEMEVRLLQAQNASQEVHRPSSSESMNNPPRISVIILYAYSFLKKQILNFLGTS